jgi:hypothetical protein
VTIFDMLLPMMKISTQTALGRGVKHAHRLCAAGLQSVEETGDPDRAQLFAEAISP